MATEYYLVDRERKELYALGKSSSWIVLSREDWTTEWSLALGLWHGRAHASRSKRLFYRSVYDACHIWLATSGLIPSCGPGDLDSRFNIYSDQYGDGFTPPESRWPVVWNAYVHSDECRAWVDRRYGPNFFAVWKVMSS